MGAMESPDSLHVLFIAAEADPFIKVGGLGDVAGSLPIAIKHARPDIDIRLAIPYYGSLKLSSPANLLTSYAIASKGGPVQVDVFQTILIDMPVYLIAGTPIHPENPVYGTDFVKDAEKFIFFSLACLHLPEHLNWEIDILHANDWHTAVALHELSTLSKKVKKYQKIKSLITLHNLPFMGTGSEAALQKFIVAPAQNLSMPEWSRTLPLPMGLNAADRIVAVSPSYAQEILLPGFGCDLQGFLATKKNQIFGILNGIDTSVWDPITDTTITKNFSRTSLSGRDANKKALQQELSLVEDPSVPLLAFIGRLDAQKGIDLLIGSIKAISPPFWQLVVLGTGSPNLEEELRSIQDAYPGKLRFVNKFDANLSHRIYSSADILLMPSRYEPCGLAQMIAMRYGCIPVATATGGLKDSIHDYSQDPGNSTGFLSKKTKINFFTKQISLAISVFQDTNSWRKIQVNAMDCDFSWKISAKKYISLYDELTQ